MFNCLQRNIQERALLQEYILSPDDRQLRGTNNSWGGRYIDSDPGYKSTVRNGKFDDSNSILALDVESIELNRVPYPARGKLNYSLK